MQISVSDLELYIQCPRAYRLHEIDGARPQHKSLSSCRAASVRKVVWAIHRGERKACDCTRQEIDAMCGKIWQEEVAASNIDREELNAIVVQEKPATAGRNGAQAVTKGERALDDIREWCFEYSREEACEVLYSGIHFQTAIADSTFVGCIDQVRKVGEDMQILAFSTGCQAPHPAFLDRDFAMSLHAHAVWQGALHPRHPDPSGEIRLKTMPALGVYHFPHLERYQKKTGDHRKGERKGNPLIPVSRSKEQLLEFEYEVLAVVSGIEQGFFPMMPRNPVGCAVCQYSHACAGTQPADVSFNVEEFENEEDAA